MSVKQHILVALVFFGLLAFEIIVYTSIIKHPYMVALCLFLGMGGGWNLGLAYAKK